MSHVPQLRRSDNLKYRYMKKEKQSAHAAAALECGSFNEQKFLTGKFLIIEFHQKNLLCFVYYNLIHYQK